MLEQGFGKALVNGPAPSTMATDSLTKWEEPEIGAAVITGARRGRWVSPWPAPSGNGFGTPAAPTRPWPLCSCLPEVGSVRCRGGGPGDQAKYASRMEGRSVTGLSPTAP